MCIRFVNCEKKTYGQACSPCYLFYNNLYFLNRIRAVTPDPKNIKYTPKFYYNNNPLLSYLKNNHIKQLHNIFYNENSSLKDFWTKFSEKATEGIFEQKPVFKELCYIMLQATKCENQDKGLQNLKYSNEFLNFLVILESISLKALNLFHQNLADINVRTI
ncbi:28897_t:CDS:1, partial [Gigaspora margarita]